MSEKFQPSEEMFDDVEGHGRRHPVSAETEDTEGHAHRATGQTRGDDGDDDGDDTEGHGVRVRI